MRGSALGLSAPLLGLEDGRAVDDIARQLRLVPPQHHPPLGPDKLVDFALKGLWDAKRKLAVLDQLARGLVLHGHNHVRFSAMMLPFSSMINKAGK